MALKPDVTLSIAKNLTPPPGGSVRVYYDESVYRAPDRQPGLPGDYAGRARVSGRGGRLRRRRGRRDCPRRARRDRAGRRAGYYAHGLHKRPHRRRRGPGQGRGGDNARGVAAQRARRPGRMRRRRDIRRAGGAAVPRGGPLRAAEGEPARPRGAQRERPRPSVPSGSSRSSPGCWTPSGRWRA